MTALMFDKPNDATDEHVRNITGNKRKFNPETGVADVVGIVVGDNMDHQQSADPSVKRVTMNPKSSVVMYLRTCRINLIIL